MNLSDWFKGFEKGISCLSSEQRTSFFSECGKNCVKCGTLQIYQELYEKANGDLNTFFEEADRLPGVRSEIIEKDSIYHCILWNVLVCFISGVTFLLLYFANVPNKAFFMFCIRYGKIRSLAYQSVNPFYGEVHIVKCELR